MNDSNVQTAGRLLGRIAMAFVQGGVLWWLYRSIEQKTWLSTEHGLLYGLIAAAILLPVAHYLVTDLTTDRRRFWVLPPLALALFGFGWHHGEWTAGDGGESFVFALALIVLVFHALPFVQSWLVNRRLRPDYENLFRFAWRNTLLVAFGGVFSGVFWLLLWVWGSLFRMLGIDFFRDLFDEAYFAIPATSIAAGIGMQLAGSVERLQNVLRNTLLTMLKWLAPLAMLILALFTLTLLVKSPELLLEQRRIISATWLLWLVALTVMLLNTAYQDGKVGAPYPPWLGHAIRFVVPLLVPVALLAAYALGVRIDSYGMTVARGWALLVAALAIAYAGGYAWAALRKGPWMERMGVVNVGVALTTVLLLTLMLSPVLSPERLAANSQYARVLDQQEEDSYRYLRFSSGEYGRVRLRELAKLEDHPEAATIRVAAQTELDRKNRWYGGDESVELGARDFLVFPAGQVVDDELLVALTRAKKDLYLGVCDPSDPCLLLFADLNRDGESEVVIFGDFVAGALRREDGRWTRTAAGVQIGANTGMVDRKAIRKALEQGRYQVRDLGWQVVEIRGNAFVFDDAPPPAGATAPPAGD